MTESRFAIVTGASSGIGLELARCCAADHCDLLLCADEPEIEAAALSLPRDASMVQTLQADLGTDEGVTSLLQAVGDKPVDIFIANAGRGLGGAFLDQDLDRVKEMIALNITATTSLLHQIGRGMRARNKGRILITGSIAGFMPGSYQAVYNATKAYLDSLSYALRDELRDTDITVTCLMPGPTETEFFERADMENTPVGQDENKSDPAKVAQDGYEAMMKGEAGTVSGFMNKVQSVFAGIIPDTVLAQMHRRMAEPER